MLPVRERGAGLCVRFTSVPVAAQPLSAVIYSDNADDVRV